MISSVQSQALLVLPFFTTLPEEPLAELRSALEALVASHFPMQSDEFAKGSLHRNNYMDCIRKVISVLQDGKITSDMPLDSAATGQSASNEGGV